MSAPATAHIQTAARARYYYGWTVLIVAAAAMVGTLPGRTQGLGLITEPLLADLGTRSGHLRRAEFLGDHRRFGGSARHRTADRPLRQPRRS